MLYFYIKWTFSYVNIPFKVCHNCSSMKTGWFIEWNVRKFPFYAFKLLISSIKNLWNTNDNKHFIYILLNKGFRSIVDVIIIKKVLIALFHIFSNWFITKELIHYRNDVECICKHWVNSNNWWLNWRIAAKMKINLYYLHKSIVKIISHLFLVYVVLLNKWTNAENM